MSFSEIDRIMIHPAPILATSPWSVLFLRYFYPGVYSKVDGGGQQTLEYPGRDTGAALGQNLLRKN